MSDGMTDKRSGDPDSGRYIGLDRTAVKPRASAPNPTQLTAEEAELLQMLAEEAAEIVQAAMKTLRHGWDSYNPTVPPEKRISNVEHLEYEIKQLLAIVKMLRRSGIVDMDFAEATGRELDNMALRKLQYTHHQRHTLKEQLLRALGGSPDPVLSKPTDYINDR